jgi:NAD-dependent dihydropyrimidine dehydrogenase PreA subunit
MYELTELLNNPEEHYPGNFDTPQRANALLTGLCQDAAKEIAKLQAEVLEQCRIIAMSAEREDALRAELTRLKASIALDKKAENARELGLDYEPAVQEKCFLCGERVDSCASDVCPKSAQPAVQEGRDWSLLEATQESLREHMAEIKRLKAAQPVPVQHDECVVCGDKVRVIPRPWVGLSEKEVEAYDSWADFQVGCGRQTLFDMVRDIEAKLKGKNT